MGNCCTCCKRKNNNYNPYVDEDYMEYESPAPHHRYSAVPSNTNNNQSYSTQPQTHPSSRPPDTGTYSPPPVSTSPRNSYNASQQPPPSQQPTQPTQPQYSHYSESVYLARGNAQPTDSMLLDSMMKSSILATGYAANSGEFATSSSTFGADSTMQASSANNFATDSNNFGTASNNTLDASLAASNASSIYYDATGTTQSFLLSSVNEGAFEPNPPTQNK